jgi:2-oxo-4-hydroxy-4-carboxy-5-ureidoimidazoline decarboxylase
MNATCANAVLERWNALDRGEAVREILPCCGSDKWAEQLVSRRPFGSVEELLDTSDAVWRELPEREWLAAFESHPRIGQQHAERATAKSLEWSSNEQSAAMAGEDAVKAALADGNRRYEEKFGRIFIVCAAGRPAEEILAVLERRMKNAPEAELQEAAEQQRQITALRLRRWMGVN